MKNGVIAVLVVAALLSTSGSTLGAGKMGGASGMDIVGQDNAPFTESPVDAIDEELAPVDGLSGR
jgi:hypothetical protein